MKAAVINSFGGPEVIEMGEITVPQILKDELLIEVAAGSLNPIDYKQRKGNHKLFMGSDFPIVLGYDVSGIVVETGASVKSFEKGDRVCGVLNNKYGGGLGQFAKGAEKCFVKLSTDIDLKKSASIPLAALTALQTLRDKAKIEAGKKVLIIGAAGGVGHYALQIAALYNTELFALSSNRHKSFIKKLAKCNFIDYTKENISESNQRFDIIFDTIGKYPFLVCRKILNPNGIHVNILPRPKILAYKFLSLFTKGKKARTHLMQHSNKDLKLLINWVEEGKLKLCIDKEFPIEKVSEAHRYMEEGHTEGKILITYA